MFPKSYRQGTQPLVLHLVLNQKGRAGKKEKVGNKVSQISFS